MCDRFWHHPVVAMNMDVHMHVISQHCPKVSYIRIFIYEPCPQCHHMSVWAHLFICKPFPSAIDQQGVHICSHTAVPQHYPDTALAHTFIHMPCSSATTWHVGMGTSVETHAVSQCNPVVAWMCMFACCVFQHSPVAVRLCKLISKPYPSTIMW